MQTNPLKTKREPNCSLVVFPYGNREIELVSPHGFLQKLVEIWNRERRTPESKMSDVYWNPMMGLI